MKLKLMKSTLCLTALLLACVATRAADGTIKYIAKPGCVVTVDGTSTIHDWTVKGAIIGGSLEVEPEFKSDLTLKSVKSLTTKDAAPKLLVKIPIKSLKSQALVAASKMDEVMQAAMRMTNNPDILYTVKEMTVKGDVPASGTPVTFATKGDLAVSGVTNAIAMDVTMDRLPDDKLKFSGATTLKMTDFKIAPPAPKILGMPTISTGDEVKLKFEWLLGLQKPAADAAK